ncbi:MAG: SDR family NAD(P)-dependent oxidoreductase, partial [Pseudomonadota bacterium]
MSKTLLSFGHGFSARALAPRLIREGWRVIGTTRSAEKAESIAATGVEPLIWPGADVSGALEAADALLISAGPGPEGDPVLQALGAEIRAAAPRFDWVGYLSTTGVYGDHAGGWVDEATPLTPSTKRGQARVTAEAQWQAIPGLKLHIFRLAGIYGPGRGPFAKVRKGTSRRIIKKGQ